MNIILDILFFIFIQDFYINQYNLHNRNIITSFF